MNILIVGNTKLIALSLAQPLLKERHSVVIIGSEDFRNQSNHKNLFVYDLEEKDYRYKEIFQAYSFDVVLYIAAYEEHKREDLSASLAKSSKLLLNTLTLSSQFDVERFIYISSLEVFGADQQGLEKDEPIPDTMSGYVLKDGEDLCAFFSNDTDLKVSIVRIPYLYGEDLEKSFIYQFIASLKVEMISQSDLEVVRFRGILHVNDLLSFMHPLIEDTQWPDLEIFHIASEKMNFSFFLQLIQFHFPELFQASRDLLIEDQQILEFDMKKAKQIYDWTPQIKLLEEINPLIQSIQYPDKEPGTLIRRWQRFRESFRTFLVWAEVLFGAMVMHLLTQWTDTVIEFKNIDYRLLYVVIIGSTHGLLYGIAASLLAIVSSLIAWNSLGLDWALLIYNVENWIPYALYFLAGGVTGYVNDKKKNDIQFEQHQTELIHEKYEFLYSLYNEISTIKDRLREQLVGYRDSFGRFFRIANELNDLDEDVIFLKALEILENLMKNDQISIYTVSASGYYARLEVKSKNMQRPIPKSLNLEDFPKAIQAIREGEVFQNKELIANYPAYIAPINDQEKLIGLLIIWDVEFEQYSMYYLNLFKVISGMIQSSLVRAATFRNAQLDEVYLQNTRILKPESFRKTVGIRKRMQRNKILEFQVLAIPRNGQTWQQLFERLSRGIRDEDVVGVLDERDSKCFVLLTQAGIENIDAIQGRLSNLGLDSEYVAEFEVE